MTKAELVGKVAAAMRLPKHQTETVAYLPIADKYFRPLPSPLRGVHQRVMDS